MNKSRNSRPQILLQKCTYCVSGKCTREEFSATNTSRKIYTNTGRCQSEAIAATNTKEEMYTYVRKIVHKSKCRNGKFSETNGKMYTCLHVQVGKLIPRKKWRIQRYMIQALCKLIKTERCIVTLYK